MQYEMQQGGWESIKEDCLQVNNNNNNNKFRFQTFQRNGFANVVEGKCCQSNDLQNMF